MSTLYETITRLQNQSGNLAKASILEEHRDDAELAAFLNAVYEPGINYYMTALPAQKEVGSRGFDAVKKILAALSTREVTGHAARDMVAQDVNALTAEAYQLLKMCINRDIKAGVGTTSINKVWPGLITDVPYMRCVLPKDAKVSTWKWVPGFQAFSQLKADGMYINASVKDNRLTLTSRNGSVMPPVDFFKAVETSLAAIATVFPYEGVQFQGELLVVYQGEVMPREKGNGILNSVLKTGDDPGADYSAKFICWDAIPLDGAKAKAKIDIPYRARWLRLSEAMTARQTASVEIVETRLCDSYEEAVAHFNELLARGEEGSILKHPEAIWMDGNNRQQCKMKVEFTVDLIIKGFRPGNANGRHADTFGSLDCQSADGLLSVGVSGMPDALRAELHGGREFYMDKIVGVTANSIMKADDGKASLFLPRLVEVRRDKTEADTMAHIQAQFDAVVGGKS